MDDVVKEHQALFLWFHNISVEQWMQLDYMSVANTIAYAEYYQLLPHVATPIEKYLIHRQDIWSEVRENTKFFLGIALKTRSAPLFEDALRHLVGNHEDWKELAWDFEMSNEKAAFLVLPKREELNERISQLTSQLWRLELPPYMGEPDSELPLSSVGSTYLASGFHEKTTIEKANWIARSIFNEWLSQHLAGRHHWSHVRHHDSEYSDGNVVPARLRFLCYAISTKCQNGSELYLFNRNAPAQYTNMFFEGKRNILEIQIQISDGLRLLVQTANTYIQPMITPPPSDAISEERQYFRQPERTSRRRGDYGLQGGRGRGYGSMTGRARSFSNIYGK